MFYLKEFFKCLKYGPARFSFFVLFSVLLVIFFVQKDFLEKKIRGYFSEEIMTPHFYALIPNKFESKKIIKKIKTLPGIQSASFIGERKINQKIEKGIKRLKLNGRIFEKKYTGVKIFFEKELSLKGQDLIKKYLSRFIGSEKVVLGKTIAEKNYKIKKQKSEEKVKRIFWFYNILPLFILWMISFRLLGQIIKKRSYLIENFQRKKNVYFKIVFTGKVFIFLLSLLMMLPFGVSDYFFVFSLLLIFIFMSLVLSLEKNRIWL